MLEKCRVNKYPFFLFLTTLREVDVNLNNMSITSDIGISKIKKVATWKIILLKYLPFIMLLANGTLPNNKDDGIIFIISFLIVLLSIAIFIKWGNTFLWYLIGLIVLINYFIYIDLNNAIYIDVLVLYIAELILFILILIDIVQKKYENYYYLVDVKKLTTVNISHKHDRPIIPLWGKKGFLKIKRGFNWRFNYSIGGYYIRIPNEK